jgi:XTP/dITP diphosphohydrolase
LSSSYRIKIDFAQLELIEIQSSFIDEIAKDKARQAFDKVCLPILVEDDGLFIRALSNFPGPYSSYVLQTIGNNGILKLLTDSADRFAYFCSVMAFYDGQDLCIFEGKIEGKISDKMIGDGWGYDPIFAPVGADSLTFAQLKSKKNEYSHRKKAFEKFAQWYLNK